MNLRKNILQSIVVVISMTILKANATCAPLLNHSVRQLAGDQVDRLCEIYQRPGSDDCKYSVEMRFYSAV